ncbi:MAG TPA: hypothetical protein VGK73_10530 [Polyangiaceae bacterium]
MTRWGLARRGIFAALLLGAALSPRTARTEEERPPAAEPAPSSPAAREAARRLYLQGTRHIEAGECELAVAVYRRSFDLFPSRSTLVNMAHCEARLGRLVEAWLLLSRALAPSKDGAGLALSAERSASAQAEQTRLRARLPFLIVHGPGNAELEVDGARIVPIDGSEEDFRLTPSPEAVWTSLPVGSRIYVNPGTYRVGQRSNEVASYRELELAEGTVFGLFVATTPSASASERTVSPAPEPATSPAPLAAPSTAWKSAPLAIVPRTEPRPYRTIGFGGLVAGGVAFATALVGVGLLLDAESELESCSPDGGCPPELDGAVARYETAAVITNVGLITGVAASAAGFGFLLADHVSSERVTVRASASSVRVSVRF